MGMQTQRGRSVKRERQIAAFSAELQAWERKQKAKKDAAKRVFVPRTS